VTRARLAVSLVFFLHGMAVGTWVSRIPAVQANLGLGEAALGLALLGAGLGSLLAMVPLAFGAAGRSRDMPAGPAATRPGPV
jgi:hypothetical protein